MSLNSRIVAPIIAGIDKRNEKRADISRSRPKKRPTAMVEPDLEIPGKMEMPCISPIISASFMEKCFMLFLSSFSRTVMIKSVPVTMSISPTKTTDEKIRSTIL